jgi:hypothetical protein
MFVYVDANGQRPTDTSKTTILAVEENEMAIAAAQRKVINNQVPKYVTQARASFLLGMPEGEHSRILPRMNVRNSPRWGLHKWKDHFSNIFIVRLHTLTCV